MKSISERLRAEFPFKWRVSNTNKFTKKCQAVAYCDARQIQDVLDSVLGSENWQDKYYDVGGTTYCSVGLRIEGEWIWKSDCGTESNIEAEKGEASDAFKRACVKHGVSRFLYSTRSYTLKAIEVNRGGKVHWVPADDKGNEIAPWAVTDYINGKRGTTKSMPAGDPSATQNDAAGELAKLETWLNKYKAERVCLALKWMGKGRTIPEYKSDGVADIARADYMKLCTLVKLTADVEIFEMCLDGFGHKTIKDGGIDDMFKKGNSDKILDEFNSIEMQGKNSK